MAHTQIVSFLVQNCEFTVHVYEHTILYDRITQLSSLRYFVNMCLAKMFSEIQFFSQTLFIYASNYRSRHMQ